MNYKIDPIKATDLWKPIIENLEYKGNKLEQIAYYAEHHRLMESLDINIGKIGKNFLPVAMKILTSLNNLNESTFNVVETHTTDRVISVKIDKDELTEHLLKYGAKSFATIQNIDPFELIKMSDDNPDIKASMNLIQKLETKIIEKAISTIDDSITSLISNNSEVIFETNVLVKNINIKSRPVPNDAPTMDMVISYNIKSKRAEPKNEQFFVYLTKENLNESLKDKFDYCLHNKTGEIFFAKKGDEIHTHSKYENIKYKLDELCKTLTEHEPYNYELIEKLRF